MLICLYHTVVLGRGYRLRTLTRFRNVLETVKSVFMSGHQNAEQDHSTKIANKPFENVAKYIYLGKRVTNQNSIHEVIESS